jgi:peptidoglycan/LPS O-acetylase OafA/YrhL
MKRLMAAMSFSFLIIGAFIAWDAYGALRGFGRNIPTWQIVLEFAGALVCVILAMVGAKIRHQQVRERRVREQ